MADVASSMNSWSATANSNSPSNSTAVGSGLDDNLREIQAAVRAAFAHKGTDIASGATVNMASATGHRIDVTHSSGTTAITSFGTLTAGMWKVVKFVISGGTLTLNHNATSMILPGGANITLENGDTGLFHSRGSGNWELNLFQRAASLSFNGGTVANATTFSDAVTVTGAATFAGDVTLESADGGASAEPVFALYRNSASPAASDFLGYLSFDGNDSAGNRESYARITATISDATNGSEEGILSLSTILAGSLSARFRIGAGLYASSLTDLGAGTINATALYDDGVQILPQINETAVTASGTSVTFSGLRAGLKTVKIALAGLSSNGTSDWLIRIGPVAGVETTSYSSAAGSQAGTADGSTVGFLIRNGGTAAQAFSGVLELTLLNASNNTWSLSGNIGDQALAAFRYCAGSKAIAGALSVISITTVNGTDTFDAGVVGLVTQ